MGRDSPTLAAVCTLAIDFCNQFAPAVVALHHGLAVIIGSAAHAVDLHNTVTMWLPIPCAAPQH